MKNIYAAPVAGRLYTGPSKLRATAPSEEIRQDTGGRPNGSIWRNKRKAIDLQIELSDQMRK